MPTESGAPDADVELRQLRYFVCLAEELHFGRAASRLFISQPGLSQSVAKLERSLGVTLLERSGSGVRLTEAGREFAQHARHLLADVDNAVRRVRGVAQGQAGVLRVGVALLAEQTAAPALAAFGAEYPGVLLDRTAAVSERLLAQVSDGSLQAAFVHQLPNLTTMPGLEWELVRRARLAVLMSQRHRLAGLAEVALRQLSAETFLVNPRQVAPGAFQGLKLMCAEFGGFDPNVLESATASIDTDWEPVRAGQAIVVTARETASAIRPPDIVMVPIQPPPRHALALAWRPREQSALLDGFLVFVREYAKTHGWSDDN
jgi:DNA-binding transcriptional LysR family regulator